MRRSVLVLSLALLSACSDSGENPFNGPVQMAVDPATNHQEARAADADSLPRTVDAVLWRGRGSDGLAHLRLVTPAYAQTAVDGAPVVGAVVNSVGVGECPLTAWNPAAQTDADGLARFWYEPGQRAGTCMAEIRYADGDTRVVTDTVVAQVAPGPVADFAVLFDATIWEPGDCGAGSGPDRQVLHVPTGGALDFSTGLVRAADAFANLVPVDAVAADTANHAGYTLLPAHAGAAEETPASEGWSVALPSEAGAYEVWFYINQTQQGPLCLAVE